MSKVETQFGSDIYLNECTEYDVHELEKLFINLLKQMNGASKSGLKNVFVQFRSTLDPYEAGCTGPVEVQIRGYRELNSLEKMEQQEQERIQALADKLGITFYEASVADRLEKQKKIKL